MKIRIPFSRCLIGGGAEGEDAGGFESVDMAEDSPENEDRAAPGCGSLMLQMPISSNANISAKTKRAHRNALENLGKVPEGDTDADLDYRKSRPLRAVTFSRIFVRSMETFWL